LQHHGAADDDAEDEYGFCPEPESAVWLPTPAAPVISVPSVEAAVAAERRRERARFGFELPPHLVLRDRFAAPRTPLKVRSNITKDDATVADAAIEAAASPAASAADGGATSVASSPLSKPEDAAALQFTERGRGTADDAKGADEAVPESVATERGAPATSDPQGETETGQKENSGGCCVVM
jgi:hypothetical protein